MMFPNVEESYKIEGLHVFWDEQKQTKMLMCKCNTLKRRKYSLPHLAPKNSEKGACYISIFVVIIIRIAQDNMILHFKMIN